MTNSTSNGIAPGSSSNGIAPDSSSKVSTSADSLLSQLPGLSASDSNTLLGRNRLAQALELEDPQDNLFVRRSLYVLGAAALIFFPWAALTPITQVIEASGEVIPQGSVNIIQHLEGGIVSSVNVKNGQSVTKGEALLQLNPQMVGSEFSATKSKLDALIIQQEQLRAAIRGDDVLPSQNNIDVLNPSEIKVSDAQQNLLTSRLANASDQLKSASAVVAEKSAEINGLNKQLKLLIEERDMWASLTQDGASSRLQLVNAQAKVEEIRGARNEATKALAQAKANLQSLQSGLVLEQNSEIAALVNEESVVAENIKKVRFQLSRMVVKAPVSGTVSDLRFSARGAVVAPGAVVASVVPAGTTKLVEARIPSQDIGFVHIGQDVDVNLQPFDSSIYGTIPGRLTSISGDTVQNPDDRQFYYNVTIELDRQYLDSSNKKYPVQVGMPIVADIKGQRSNVLQYLFHPFVRTLNGAMRE